MGPPYRFGGCVGECVHGDRVAPKCQPSRGTRWSKKKKEKKKVLVVDEDDEDDDDDEKRPGPAAAGTTNYGPDKTVVAPGLGGRRWPAVAGGAGRCRHFVGRLPRPPLVDGGRAAGPGRGSLLFQRPSSEGPASGRAARRADAAAARDNGRRRSATASGRAAAAAVGPAVAVGAGCRGATPRRVCCGSFFSVPVCWFLSPVGRFHRLAVAAAAVAHPPLHRPAFSIAAPAPAAVSRRRSAEHERRTVTVSRGHVLDHRLLTCDVTVCQCVCVCVCVCVCACV